MHMTTNQVFELAKFTLRDGHERALLDVILWRSREDAEYSAAHAAEVPEAASWFGHIAEFLGIEQLTVLGR